MHITRITVSIFAYFLSFRRPQASTLCIDSSFAGGRFVNQSFGSFEGTLLTSDPLFLHLPCPAPCPATIPSSEVAYYLHCFHLLLAQQAVEAVEAVGAGLRPYAWLCRLLRVEGHPAGYAKCDAPGHDLCISGLLTPPSLELRLPFLSLLDEGYRLSNFSSRGFQRKQKQSAGRWGASSAGTPYEDPTLYCAAVAALEI